MHTCTHTHTHTHTHSHSLSLSIFPISLSHTHTHMHKHAFCLSVSLSVSCTHTHTHTHAYAHTHIRTKNCLQLYLYKGDMILHPQHSNQQHQWVQCHPPIVGCLFRLICATVHQVTHQHLQLWYQLNQYSSLHRAGQYENKVYTFLAEILYTPADMYKHVCTSTHTHT